MKDVLIIFVIPAIVLWMVVLLIYLSKKNVDKKATEKVTGVVLSNTTYTVTSSDRTSYGRVSLVEYTINGKQYKKEFQINQLIYFHKIPIGQRKGLPVHSKVELRYNPTNVNQIFSAVDNQFGKRFMIFFFSIFAAFWTLFPILFLLKELGIRF
ncbi:hypothetical protein ATZ33_00880 [Enterococcus silesiacus]|uniref:DUF3592 domain-containing protein n=1 Tax=Enterococcus silesiacus TaxID=332949 RepID=A0A0S3K6Z2_9ENTE|nr:DUF3592 domain-containing protein [Enterococcus silesiacus]ALR99985.1 hypothetical protein ATZ33_00880 [Enterococcus silesiacus]OJG92703.1 hypothetical protein RV15_GL002648 [Enterococcus silesiacus]